MANQPMQERIEQVLASVRPAIEMHGGDIEYVSLHEGVLSIRFLGACIGCPISSFTLKLGIEEAIKKEIPEITEVVALE